MYDKPLNGSVHSMSNDPPAFARYTTRSLMAQLYALQSIELRVKIISTNKTQLSAGLRSRAKEDARPAGIREGILLWRYREIS